MTTRVEMLSREIPGADGREAVMFLITLPPGAAAPVHAHPGIGGGYVLEGSYESQYEGETLQRFEAGDALYDLAHIPHLIARNASSTQPLKFLMTFIVAKGDSTLLPLPQPQ